MTNTSELVEQLEVKMGSLTGALARLRAASSEARSSFAPSVRWARASFRDIDTVLAEIDRLREENTRWLLRFADIRIAAGVNERPMMDELPGEIAALRARALAAEAEVARLTASLAVWVPHAACPPSVSSGRTLKDTPHD